MAALICGRVEPWRWETDARASLICSAAESTMSSSCRFSISQPGARERSEDYSSSRGARVAMGAGMVAMAAATVVVGVVVGLPMTCGQCIGTLR